MGEFRIVGGIEKKERERTLQFARVVDLLDVWFLYLCSLSTDITKRV